MSSLSRKQKRSVGRPSSYRPEYCSKIIKAMAGGLSAEAAAAKVGISARSLFYWQREHPEFLQAIQEGRQQGLLWWENRAQAMAKGKPGNTQIVMLGLRNRSRAAHGWNNETLKVEHSGPDGPLSLDQPNVIDVSSMLPEERAALKAAMLQLTAKNEVDD